MKIAPLVLSLAAALTAVGSALAVSVAAPVPSPADPDSIQAAIDANPDAPLYLPAGEYRIAKPVRLTHAGGGLVGPGTIVQTDDDAAIVEVRGAARVRIEGVTLTRAEPKFFRKAAAIDARKSEFLLIKEVSILSNRAEYAALMADDCDQLTIEGCSIVDFKTIAIDDRMKDDLYRYAFRAINGHGIAIRNCHAVRLVRNRIVEHELRPTEAAMKKYELGKIVNRAPELGKLASYGVKDGFVFIWHQGGGILLNDGDRMSFALIDGNFIENAAQGMDLHGDFLVVTNNQVTNCYMGMKAFHGARGVVIANNIFHQPGKYGILLRPGSASYEASAAAPGRPAREENVQRSIIIANNLITDMGYGDEHWRLWNDDPTETSPVGIKIGTGPLKENPRLTDVVIQGNIIADHGRDGILVDGKPTVAPPRYKWAIWFDDEWRATNVRLSGNIFHPGEKGVSNLPIEP